MRLFSVARIIPGRRWLLRAASREYRRAPDRCACRLGTSARTGPGEDARVPYKAGAGLRGTQFPARKGKSEFLEICPGGVGRGRDAREVFRGCGDGGKQGDDTVHLSELQGALEHAGGTGEAEISLRLFEAGKTANDAADGGAVNVGESGDVEDDAFVSLTDQLGHLVFQAAAIGSGMNAALHTEGRHAGYDLVLCDFENHEAFLH